MFNEAGTKLKMNEKMANDSMSESFAIRFLAKMSERRTRHSYGIVRGEDTVAALLRGRG